MTLPAAVVHQMGHPDLALAQHFLLLALVRRGLGPSDLHGSTANLDAVELGHGLGRVVADGKVDEGVVLDLLDALDGALGLERLLELLLGHALGQVADVEHLDLGRTGMKLNASN